MNLLKSKKVWSLFLSLAMIVSLMPKMVFAADGDIKTLTVGEGETYETIQAAVDAIAVQEDPAGWTVTVKNGTYDRFSVTKPVSDLTVVGESSESTIVNVLQDAERFQPYDNGGINVWAPNVTLENLRVVSGTGKNSWSDAAISTNHSHSGGSGNSLTLESCVVLGPGVNAGAANYGVFWNCDRVEVKNSYIANFNNAIEFMLDGYSIPTGATYEMTGNTIENCSFAIHGYMGGDNGTGTLAITNNTISGTEDLRAKVIVQENAADSLTAIIRDNVFENVVAGTVNLREEGEKNDVLNENQMGTGCFYVDAIEPGTIDFYTSYQAPENTYGHWELHDPEGLSNIGFIKDAIIKANKEGSHTLNITGIPDGELIKTFTCFKDCIYWVTDPTPSDPVVPDLPKNPDWAVSKSKTATNLDKNFESNIRYRVDGILSTSSSLQN